MDKNDVVELFETVLTALACPFALPIIANRDIKMERMERMEKLAEALRKAFDEVNKKIEEHKRLLRRPPKWYIKANIPAMIVSRRRVYHCRDRC